MSAGSYIIGLGGGIACLGIAWAIGRAIARVEFAIDETFGDMVAVPAEATRAAGKTSGGMGSKARRLDTQHSSGPHTDRLGAV